MTSIGRRVGMRVVGSGVATTTLATIMATTALFAPANAQAPAVPTQAQTSAEGQPVASADPTSNEIVVTAQKRSETVQKTPLSITAYSGAQLTAQGINTIEQVGYVTPGVSERNSGPGQTEFEMRGIASSGGQSPTVGFYLDETPLTPPNDAQLGKVVVDPNLYDLNRVEVLRGPQGTLYGAGSMGGTIRIITNQPDPNAFYGSFDATLSGTKGGGANYGGDAMVNIPLATDRAALRIVGTDKYTDGWIDRIVLSPFPMETAGGTVRGDVTSAPVERDHHDVNNEHVQGVRASLLLKPSDDFSITPSVFYQKIHQDGLSYADNPPGVDHEAHYQPYDVAEPYSDSFTLYSLTAKYHLPAFDITSSTGYYLRHTSMDEDSAESTQDFFESVIGIPDVSYADVGPFVTTAQDSSKQFTEELRLTSNSDGPFQWLIGGFYQHFDSKDDVFTNATGPIVEDVLGIPSLYDIRVATKYKQYAGFGEASYKILPNLKFTAGLRYFSYTTHERLAEAGGLPNGSLTPTVFNLPASAHGFNPKFNLSFTPSRDLTIYAQATRGFRPGGGNTPPPSTCPQNTPLQYDPDSLWSYELGEKAQLFGSRLTVNADVYYEDWTGIQQSVAQPCGSSYTANAGTAHVYGSEVEITARLTHQFTITNSTGYTHAEIVKGVAGGTFYPGEKVQEVPKWTNSTILSYRQPVTDRYTFVASAVNAYIASMNDVSYTINKVPAHDILNLRAGVEWDKMKVDLFVDNVTDKRAIIANTNALSFNVATFNRVATNQPRTIGVTLSYNFGRE